MRSVAKSHSYLHGGPDSVTSAETDPSLRCTAVGHCGVRGVLAWHI
jgi:hypothetical protein